MLRTVVAFANAGANTAGGTVLVGVEDGTRHVRGVTEPLALEERIASLITDSIAPRLLADLEVLSYRKTHVVAVQVYPNGVRRPLRVTEILRAQWLRACSPISTGVAWVE